MFGEVCSASGAGADLGRGESEGHDTLSPMPNPAAEGQDSAPPTVKKNLQCCKICGGTSAHCTLLPTTPGELELHVCPICAKSKQSERWNKQQVQPLAVRRRKGCVDSVQSVRESQAPTLRLTMENCFEYYSKRGECWEQDQLGETDIFAFMFHAFQPAINRTEIYQKLVKSGGAPQTISIAAEQKVKDCIKAADKDLNQQRRESRSDTFDNELSVKGSSRWVLLELPHESGFSIFQACPTFDVLLTTTSGIFEDTTLLLKGRLDRALEKDGKIVCARQLGSAQQPVVVVGWLEGNLEYDPKQTP
eukprot:535659-Rhodomonas_salina.1